MRKNVLDERPRKYFQSASLLFTLVRALTDTQISRQTWFLLHTKSALPVATYRSVYNVTNPNVNTSAPCNSYGS